MVFPKHSLLAFGGRLGGGQTQETWSCNIRLKTDTPGFPDSDKDLTVAQQEEYAEHALSVLRPFFISTAANITAQSYFEWVKVNAINPQGRYVHDTTTLIGDFSYTGFNSDATSYKPFQVSKVVSLLSNTTTGYARRGRIYLPTPGERVRLNGEFDNSIAFADYIANVIADLKYVADDGSFQVTPSIVSKSPTATGSIKPIKAIRVDSVFDTQRRRTNQLVREGYYIAVPE